MRKKSSKVKVAKGRSQLDEYAATDSDNELDDLFASGADRVGLTKDAKDSDDELDEEAVYNMDDEVRPATTLYTPNIPSAACSAACEPGSRLQGLLSNHYCCSSSHVSIDPGANLVAATA